MGANWPLRPHWLPRTVTKTGRAVINHLRHNGGLWVDRTRGFLDSPQMDRLPLKRPSPVLCVASSTTAAHDQQKLRPKAVLLGGDGRVGVFG